MRMEEKLQQMNIRLPQPPERAGLYMQTKRCGEKQLYISGCGPTAAGYPDIKGRLGAQVDIPMGQQAAKQCILNALAILKRDLGDLDQIASFTKMLAFVSSAEDFYDQPLVANGASAFLCELFGAEAGCPARSAVGVYVLPGNIPVEIELLVELK